MEPIDRANIMANSFKNPTKLGIIAVLIQKGEMTVTQISKIIGTTRSNLYQAIAELVSDGLVNAPDIRVSKNYVEKFYTINEEAFSGVPQEKLIDVITSLSSDDFRDVTVSFLLTQSVILKIIAEEISMSDDQSIGKMKELIKQNKVFLSYSRLSDQSYLSIAPEIEAVNKKLEELDKKHSVKTPRNTLLIVGIPSMDLLKTEK
ncbi:MAG: hypothetical protein B2I17_00330 [Thermoplasmatales archaeon B_DKE]|nr:MAG: hypothetical protein B2I17_00330 [Thermoplasmatales archaeon B_DKE]